MQLPKDNFSIEELICNESFQQYCFGTSLENQILWNEWIAKHPERALDIQQAKQIFDLLSARQGNRIRQLKDLRTGIKQREAFATLIVEEPAQGDVKKRSLYTYISTIAAAAVIILLSFYFLQSDSTSGIHVLFSSINSHVIYSRDTARKTIVLSDGTLITLAKESTLKLPKDFSTKNREIWLSGEAFFDVKHDKSHPFVVHTSYNDIKVLGTTFNVKAYESSKSMETSLIQGSVRVESKKYPGYSITLKPNQKLVTNNYPSKTEDFSSIFKLSVLAKAIPAENATHVKGSSTIPSELKWVRNRLDIENEPLWSIAEKLQNWYGINIVIKDDAVKNYRYSGVFENETILKTLEALQLSYPFKFKVEEARITISK
ncbi:FecR family protein [Pedobacter sp. MC2016-14]|uniref:FecR family protein n=1 Tax=Pedobacter sp. MC2016-14 TaxID=2897327 RepID=UPI001E525EE1|nr:FecR family protein [Pedobacter sp. MC2016-14]MCD0488235.1 FecR family protein [Pedobacter sp. MC2016-14]